MIEYIERFMVTMRAENASPNTIRGYRADLTDLANFVGPKRGPQQLTRIVVRAFLALTSERGQKMSTLKRKLYAIRAFGRWMTGEGIISNDDFTRISAIRSPKLPNLLPDIPSEQQMLMLLGGDCLTAFPERDRLLCELMYGVGLRVSEAARIKLGDLRPEQHAILIHGKGGMYGKAGKYRLGPLNPNSELALGTYLQARAKKLNKLQIETDALFFGLRNSDGGCISVRSVHRMLLHITKVRGLPPMHPHLLRHACATHLLDNGCSLDVIADLLGHDNLDVTAHYAQVSTRLMMQTYNAAHPHATADAKRGETASADRPTGVRAP